MRKSVLIADDREDVRSVIQSGLESAGFTVYTAVDGRDAVEKVSQFWPDIIVLDLRMPNMNGVEAAARLKNRFPKIPIIILTVYALGSTIASTLGVDATLAKTDGIGPLVACVEKLLATSPKAQSARSTANP
jgi:CheY-like chemotaxis protein